MSSSCVCKCVKMNFVSERERELRNDSVLFIPKLSMCWRNHKLSAWVLLEAAEDDSFGDDVGLNANWAPGEFVPNWIFYLFFCLQASCYQVFCVRVKSVKKRDRVCVCVSFSGINRCKTGTAMTEKMPAIKRTQVGCVRVWVIATLMATWER